jgi:hypothetical protein
VTQPATTADRRQGRSDGSALAAVFLLVIGFTYSDDIVEFLCDITGHPDFGGRQWLVFALDSLLVLGAAGLKWRIDGPTNPGAFLRRLVTGWWGVAAALVVGAHLLLIAFARQRAALSDTGAVWFSIVASLAFVTAMIALLESVAGRERGSRRWLVPLAIGTFVAQFASLLWYPAIDSSAGCAGEVSPAYFGNMGQIIPVVLLALAVELNYIRGRTEVRDVGYRVTPVFTVFLLCVAELLTFSILVKSEQRSCGLAAVWHEYIAFVITAHALTIGLATVFWLLVSDAADH